MAVFAPSSHVASVYMYMYVYTCLCRCRMWHRCQGRRVCVRIVIGGRRVMHIHSRAPCTWWAKSTTHCALRVCVLRASERICIMHACVGVCMRARVCKCVC